MDASSADRLAARIDAALPQMQCRRCGYDACRPYAEAVAAGDAINKCPPGGEATVAALAALTGRPALPLDPSRGRPGPLEFARIDEAACIGCTLCIEACPVDAIAGAPKRMHAVLEALCTGCGLCIPPCPVDCIALAPAGRTWNAEDAEAARRRYLARRPGRARVATSPPDSPADGESTASPASDAERDFRRRAAAAALERARARRGARGANPASRR